MRQRLGVGQAKLGVPGLRAADRRIHGIDILYAFGGKPILEGCDALFGVNADAVFPGGASSKDAGVLDTGVRGHGELFDEHVVIDAGAQVDEGFGGDVGGPLEVVHGL